MRKNQKSRSDEDLVGKRYGGFSAREIESV
jgi:hypothetical protein